ncbi:MAG: hypothetical protein RJQ21_16510 [Rhodospirillales bacterium]
MGLLLRTLWYGLAARRAVALSRPVRLWPAGRRRATGLLLAPDGEAVPLLTGGGLADLPYGALRADGSWWLLLPAGDARLARRWRLLSGGRAVAMRPRPVRGGRGLVLVRMEVESGDE